MIPAAMRDPVVIRRTLGRGDAEAIGDLHERVYATEYGMNGNFVRSVRDSVSAAQARGWPEAGGGVWLIDSDRGLAGSLGLTDEGGGVGRVRWFVLEPQLRARGVGRNLLRELIDDARRLGRTRLELETFSALRAAAHLYREVGFELVCSRERSDWGPTVLYQRYELEL